MYVHEYVNEYVNVYINVYCETWVRLCQAHCQKKQTKGSRVSATHCTQRGADCVCNTLVPETGPPLWKPFLLPAILRPRFWGRFLAPRKSKQELLDGPDARISSICWRQPSFCNASCHGHTHTHPYNTMRGAWRRSCFESVKRVHFPGPQEAMLTSCALAACRLYNAYVRKLFCVHLGRSVWRAIVAVHPVRALWNVQYTDKALKGT